MNKTGFTLIALCCLVVCSGVRAEEMPPPGVDRYLSPATSSDGISDTRRQLLEEAGRTVGFRGGKAERAWELKQAMETRQGTLDRLYDFRVLISHQGWLPPVIDEAVDVAHITSDQIRTASHVYEILQPERFVSNPPSWRRWLYAGLESSAEEQAASGVVTENRAQEKIWQAAIRKGWEEGRAGADHVLEANFNRLTRDYRGMLLYSLLLRQGYISAPVVTEQQQTVTGDRHKLVTGDRVRRLKDYAGFIPDKTQWRPIIKGERRD